MYSVWDRAEALGCPIRKSTDRSLFASSPWLIAGYNVLHRLVPPRHPPYALIHLTIQLQGVWRYGADSHCANATCPINQQCSSLEHGRQIKKTFRIVKEQTRRQDARKTLDCRLLGG